jgi:hypothetical protein
MTPVSVLQVFGPEFCIRFSYLPCMLHAPAMLLSLLLFLAKIRKFLYDYLHV